MPQSIQHILAVDTPLLATTLELEASTARIEVQCLLQEILQVQRVYLLAHPERVLSELEFANYCRLLQRRLTGEPIAYILGVREFFGLRLKVSPATLIPRPDTELLVELALQHIPKDEICQVLDLGTGCGAVALAIAHARPKAEILAVDTSGEALLVAQDNASTLKLSNVKFLYSNWFAATGTKQYDLIVSNPPYVAATDPHLGKGDVRFEPRTALTSGGDGLADIRHIIKQAPLHLLQSGCLLLEHGYDQAAHVRSLLKSEGFGAVFSACDLAGIERVSGGSLTCLTTRSRIPE